MRTTMKLSVPVVLALCLSGCAGDRHLGQHHGESYLKAFAAQRLRTGRPAEAITGLDAQEAAITANNYGETLVPKGQKYSDEPMILVAPPSREQPRKLAPSVPRE